MSEPVTVALSLELAEMARAASALHQRATATRAAIGDDVEDARLDDALGYFLEYRAALGARGHPAGGCPSCSSDAVYDLTLEEPAGGFTACARCGASWDRHGAARESAATP